MVELRALLRLGVRSVGVVTPFRAQADALEEAALESFGVDELEALDLRIGTVHAFQGIERDVVIASLGLGPDDGAASWRFVEDPHLLAVFVTRARDRLIFLVSADPPAGGLVRAYLDQADRPPRPPQPAGPVTAWAGAVAEELETAGIRSSRRIRAAATISTSACTSPIEASGSSAGFIRTVPPPTCSDTSTSTAGGGN